MSDLCTTDTHPQQVNCFITRTNPRTHQIIKDNLSRSAMYSGAIEGVGPRYCPSIEDKVVRFADKTEHQIFLEPEGLNTTELYPNGISTSLPFDAQLAFVRSIEGFSKAHISRPGYAIEYDYFDPRDLNYSLEVKALKGLFFAGQINGTTGYEEAAAQGLLAGINAARKVQQQAPWEPRRDEAYIGVMVDDLVNLGTSEPYRMFTSRAEFRLRLRQDNADQRLHAVGMRLRVIGAQRAKHFTDKMHRLETLRTILVGSKVRPGSALASSLESYLESSSATKVNKDTDLLELLRRPEVSAAVIANVLKASKEPKLAKVGNDVLSADIIGQIEIETKYAGYIKRQDVEIAKIRRHENMSLPENMIYDGINGLSNELQEKLTAARPTTLARASRIPGMTPAALSILLVHAKKSAQANTSQANSTMAN